MRLVMDGGPRYGSLLPYLPTLIVRYGVQSGAREGRPVERERVCTAGDSLAIRSLEQSQQVMAVTDGDMVQSVTRQPR